MGRRRRALTAAVRQGVKPTFFLGLSGTAEAVPFPIVPLPKIPRGMEVQNPTSRKGRETWGTHGCGGAGKQRVPFGFAQGRL